MNQYYLYFRESPWSVKWFVIVLALRPFAEMFYDLKYTSAFLSPLYVLGVITPILAMYFALRQGRLGYDRILGYRLVAVLISWNVLVFGLLAVNYVQYFQFAFKVMLPIVMFYYAAKCINSESTVDLLFSTLRYFAIIPIAMASYEYLVKPISEVAQSSGVDIYSGLYADSVSYGLYINTAYLALLWSIAKSEKRSRYIQLAVFLPLFIFGLLATKHLASLTVFILITAIYLLIGIKSQRWKYLTASIVVLFAIYIAGGLMAEEFAPKINRELSVFEGERSIDQGFHGRIYRWRYMMNYWYSVSMPSKLFGLSNELMISRDYNLMLAAPHNDFIRIVFLTGILGLVAYGMMLFGMLRRVARMPRRYKVVSYGAVTTLLLYSISTMPTMYPIIVFMISVIYGAIVNRLGVLRAK